MAADDRIVLVVDIDGTVADSRERELEVERKFGTDPDHWKDPELNEFLDSQDITKDKVIPGAELLPEVARAMNADIIFLTGRSERSRHDTRKWLQDNLLAHPDMPLFMRPDEDYRPGGECKGDVFRSQVLPLYEGRQFVFLEDDPSCLRVYRHHGIVLRSPECWSALYPACVISDS